MYVCTVDERNTGVHMQSSTHLAQTGDSGMMPAKENTAHGKLLFSASQAPPSFRHPSKEGKETEQRRAINAPPAIIHLESAVTADT